MSNNCVAKVVHQYRLRYIYIYEVGNELPIVSLTQLSRKTCTYAALHILEQMTNRAKMQMIPEFCGLSSS